LACSIQTRLASACRSWATSTWWLANSTAVRTSSWTPPRTPPAPGLRLASRPAAGWHTHSGSRPAGRPAAPARSGPPAPAAVGPRPRSGPRPAPCTSPGRPPPGPRRRRPGMAPRRSRAGPPPTAASPHPWSPPTWVGRPHRSR
jgi:hypothetical protein